MKAASTEARRKVHVVFHGLGIDHILLVFTYYFMGILVFSCFYMIFFLFFNVRLPTSSCESQSRILGSYQNLLFFNVRMPTVSCESQSST